jgi:alanine dehydrogenase
VYICAGGFVKARIAHRIRAVRVGVPREIKSEERRVALTPSGVAALAAHGHTVVVERGAGVGSGFPDAGYRAAGATLADAADVWASAELVVKVKEPLPSELGYLRPELLLFTYLHLAADEPLTRVLVERGVRAVAYETIQLEDGTLPLLAPMSEVAGRLAIQVGRGVCKPPPAAAACCSRGSPACVPGRS